MGIEIDLTLVLGSKITWLRVRLKNCMFLVWGSIDLFFVPMVEIDLGFVLRPRLLFVRGSNGLIFVWVVKIGLVLVWGIGIRLISVQGSKLT